MKSWIINNQDEDIPAKKIFEELVEKLKIWGFPKKARHLEDLNKGDIIIIRRKEHFICKAIIKSPPKPIEDTQYKNKMVGKYKTGEMIIELEDISHFSNINGILARDLSFVKNKKRWWDYYRGSIISCEARDINKILSLNKLNLKNQ